MDNSKSALNESNTLHTTRNDIIAFGVYDDEHFEILEGSEIDMNRKCRSATMETQYQTAISTGKLFF